MGEYEELRALILGREIEALEALRAEAAALAQETTDPEAIITRLSPMIDAILRRNIEQDRNALIDVLSPMIADILSHEIRQSGEQIAAALAPVIGKAIRVQIRDQRDEVVDALYPVIGTTVSRYVSEAFKELIATINSRLESTFSYANLRRKVISRVKGIPESELLLREHIGWRVESVFLIHKPTGLLITQVTSGVAMQEPEMVASMLTAIRSFVNEWIAQQGEDAEVNEIEYGSSTIRLEVAGYCYLAVVLRGEPGGALIRTIHQALVAIVSAHGDAITAFEGDRSTMPLEAMETELARIVQCVPETGAPGRATVPTRFLIAAGILAAAFVGYRLVREYQDDALQAALMGALRSDARLALYRVDAEVDGDRVILRGAVPDPSLQTYAASLVRDHRRDVRIDDRLMVSPPFGDADTQQQIAALNAALESLRAASARDLQGLRDAIVLPPPFTLYFALGSSAVPPQQYAIIRDIRWWLDRHPTLQVRLTGYSDSRGDEEKRLAIATARAEAVRDALQTRGVDARRIMTAGTPDPPPLFDETLDDDAAARSVVVQLVKERHDGDQ